MELEAVWQTHRRFIVRVAGGALAFLVVSIYAGGVESEARAIAQQNASAKGKLLDDLSRLQGAEGLERGRAEALERELERRLFDALLWRVDAAYAPAAAQGTSGALYYVKKVGHAAGEVADRARSRRVACPSAPAELGLPAEVDDGRLEEALARVDLVRRTALLVLDSGARAVTSLQPAEASYQPREGQEGFLRLQPVSVAFQADARALARLLSELQAEGSFLEVLECGVRRGGKRPEDPLEVRLTVQALALVQSAPEGAVRGAAARPASGGGGRRPVRRFGGPRER